MHLSLAPCACKRVCDNKRAIELNFFFKGVEWVAARVTMSNPIQYGDIVHSVATSSSHYHHSQRRRNITSVNDVGRKKCGDSVGWLPLKPLNAHSHYNVIHVFLAKICDIIIWGKWWVGGPARYKGCRSDGVKPNRLILRVKVIAVSQ